jgi:hypothetical protein
LWFLLREVGILPNDPALQRLTEIQKAWIVSCAVQDSEEISKISSEHGPSSREPGVQRVGNKMITTSRIVETELTNEEFDAISKALKEQALKQGPKVA